MSETKQLLTGQPFLDPSSIIPRELFLLGNLLGQRGTLCLGGNNTPFIRMLLRGAAAGCAASGSRASLHTLADPIQGGWALGKNQADRGLFLEGKHHDQIRIWVLDRWGLPIVESQLLQLEQDLHRASLRKVRDGQIGTVAATPLTSHQWSREIVDAAALSHLTLRRLTVAVEGQSPANAGLILALQTLGCRVESRWRQGIPCFSALRGGFALQARDEHGAFVSPDQLLALIVLLEMEQGSGRVILPPDATAAASLVTAGYRGHIEFLSDLSEDPARAQYAMQPWLWSASSAAVRICSRMRASGQRLDVLLTKIPRFGRHSREISFAERPMQAAALLVDRPSTPLPGGGQRLHTESGWLTLLPQSRSLRITAEGPDLELAAELCSQYTQRALKLAHRADGGKNSISSTQKA